MNCVVVLSYWRCRDPIACYEKRVNGKMERRGGETNTRLKDSLHPGCMTTWHHRPIDRGSIFWRMLALNFASAAIAPTHVAR